MNIGGAAIYFENGMGIFLFIIAGLLCYAAYTDIKTMEVPLYLVPAGTILQVLSFFILLTENGVAANILLCVGSSVLCGAVLFLMSYICMKYGNLGGADALISFLIGFSLQIDGVVAVMIAYLLALPYAAYIQFHKKKKDYPFVPFLAIAYILVLIFDYWSYQQNIH